LPFYLLGHVGRGKKEKKKEKKPIHKRRVHHWTALLFLICLALLKPSFAACDTDHAEKKKKKKENRIGKRGKEDASWASA